MDTVMHSYGRSREVENGTFTFFHFSFNYLQHSIGITQSTTCDMFPSLQSFIHSMFNMTKELVAKNPANANFSRFADTGTVL